MLTTNLGSVEQRATRLDTLSEELEDRSETLQFVEKRMAQFEDQLTRWQLSEAEVSRALKQLEGRQATVEGLQGDIKHMFEMAERTVEDARSIAIAHQEIERTRLEIETVLDRLHASDKVVAGLEERKRRIEQAEQRLARADALLIDIQSSLEALEGQKALVDYVVEKAGALTFQVKQAEALIDTLRDEREITNRVRSALEKLREDNPTAQAG